MAVAAENCHSLLAQLSRGEMVELGEFGDEYLAQQSLRTLTNASRRAPFDIKLPLTIYNTSCYRGIPGKYIAAGPLASRWLQQQFASDATLIRCGAQVLGEPAAGYLSHPGYAALPKAPYRYQEMLGVIWRENPSCYLEDGEQAVLMAALMETDNAGRPLIDAWIKRSGLSADAWLEKAVRRDGDPVLSPALPLRRGADRPRSERNAGDEKLRAAAHPAEGFRGDMRLVDEDFPQAQSLPAQVKDVTARLSADYIIHDLQTGNFVTVLRFISRLTLQCGVSEIRFYQIGGVLRRYGCAPRACGTFRDVRPV